jgi:amino acid transporter
MHGFGALLITLSCLSPSLGVFVVGSDVLHQAGTGAFACFAVAALLGVGMANVYAELVSAFPETGAEYTIIGRTLGPTAGFMALGLVLTGLTIAQALTALGVASYLDVIAPGLNPIVVAIALIVGVNALAILHIRLNAVITGAFLASEVVSLTVLSLMGLLRPHRSGFQAILHPVSIHGAAGLAPTSLAVMGAAAVGAVYAFNGYGGVVSIGEEIHDAPRRVARVIFWALGIAAVLQLTPIFAVIAGAPDLSAILAAKAPVPAFIAATGGRGAGIAMSLLVVLAIINTMIAVALMAGRQLYSTGRDGVWPQRVSRAVAALHPRFHSPWVATLVMGSCSVAWCFAPLKLLITVIASGTVALYAGLCLAAMRGRRTGSTAHGRYKMPFFPLAPAAALLALGAVVWTSVQDPDVGRPGLIWCGAIMAVSALLYRVWLRPTGRWAHRGPTSLEAPAGE